MQDELDILNAKILKLEQENQLLREELSMYKFQNNTKTTSQLSNEQKLTIYSSYFAGRQDVVAKRFYSKKTGKYGFSPLCKNDFNQTLCLKYNSKKIKCIKCPNRKFTVMSNELLLQHFRGTSQGDNKFCLGIYPLLRDGTCNFLAIDFDGNDWFEEIKSIYQIAKRYNLNPLLERSQSGRGGHLWLFFAEPIKAVIARKVGFILLKEGMKQNDKIVLTSFDRMFPNQDYVTDDGLGNLIALPLQSSAYRQGNSAFINIEGECISDPISYLLTIKRSTLKELEQITYSSEDVDYFFEEDQLTIPLYSDTKYDSELYLIKGKMLYIKKDNLNSLTLNMIRRLASMHNPDYYLLQRLHKPIYNTSMTLCEFVEDEKYIAIPRGCFDKLKRIFVGTVIEVTDKLNVGEEINLTFKGELSNLQKDAVNALITHEEGMLQAAAGFGKTVIALKIISEINCNTLIIVNTKKLLEQWLVRIENFLDIPKHTKKSDAYIGQYTGSKKNLKYKLDIATSSALANSEELSTLLSPYGMVIIDECHHIPSSTFIAIMRNIQAKYIYGLSATPDRQDGLEKLIYLYCGPKRYETNKKHIIAQRNFQQILVPHFTNAKCFETNLTYQQLVEEIATNESRNFMISNDIIASFKLDRKIIVLSERISHLQTLYEKVRDVSPNVFLLLGNLSQKEKKKIDESIANLKESENYIILATSKLLGEGFDLPSLDTLFLTLPIADKNRVEQYTGRIHRESVDKIDVEVHDYVDVHIPVFDGMFHKRLKAYYREGYHLLELEKVQQLTSLVYYKDTYFEVLEKDLLRASKQIIIRMNSYQIMKVKKLHKLLMQVTQSGKKVKIIIEEKKVPSEIQLYLKGAGCEFIVSNKHIKSNYVIIDKTVVWYGDMNIFNQESSSASLIRLENAVLAQELINDMQ